MSSGGIMDIDSTNRTRIFNLDSEFNCDLRVVGDCRSADDSWRNWPFESILLVDHLHIAGDIQRDFAHLHSHQLRLSFWFISTNGLRESFQFVTDEVDWIVLHRRCSISAEKKRFRNFHRKFLIPFSFVLCFSGSKSSKKRLTSSLSSQATDDESWLISNPTFSNWWTLEMVGDENALSAIKKRSQTRSGVTRL